MFGPHFFVRATARRPNKRTCRDRRRVQLFLEELETRALLSATSLNNLAALPEIQVVGSSLAGSLVAGGSPVSPDGHGGGGITNPNPVGFQPSQIRHAYGFDQIQFGTIQGDGSGQTIAIVDAYNDPNITSDLAHFDSTFGMAAPPSFLQVSQTGGSTSGIKTNSGWALEISLDVEWAHAIAPQANILLVEATTNSLSNLLTAVNYAKQHASVVSMSWGGGEFSSETTYDSTFTTSGNNVTFVASSGDNGSASGLLYPAASPNVVAVGGTTLTTLDSSGTYGSETGWSGSTGGYSLYESEPGYQKLTYPSSVTDPNGVRMNPDVAYDANPNTGFAVYDTVAYLGQTGWFEVGGTSAGAPQWAALVAIADQGRGSAGPLASSGTLYALYQAAAGSSYTTDFHDVQSGSNGSYSAGPGFDLVTGLGSPQANNLVQSLLTAPATDSTTTAASTTSKPGGTTGGSAHPHPADAPMGGDIGSSGGTPIMTINPAALTPGTQPGNGTLAGSNDVLTSFNLISQGSAAALGIGGTNLPASANALVFVQNSTVFGASGWNRSATSWRLSSLGMHGPMIAPVAGDMTDAPADDPESQPDADSGGQDAMVLDPAAPVILDGAGAGGE